MTYGYVYLIKCGQRYKIGVSAQPEKRILQIHFHSPYPVKVITANHFFNPEKVERDLHEKYWRFRQHGEWFKLSASQVKEIKSMLAVGIPWTLEREIHTSGWATGLYTDPEREERMQRQYKEQYYQDNEEKTS